MWDLTCKVIKIGSCVIDPGNIASSMIAQLKNKMGIGGGSTVTLIKEQNELLLIDTGFDRESDFSRLNRYRNWSLLKSLLLQYSFEPADITKVFITHFHHDHYGGIEYFDRAQWFCHQFAFDDFQGPLKDKFTPVQDGDQLLPNVIVKHTPGHSRGHSSLLWSADNGSVKVAICGDALLSLAWLQSGYIWKFNSDFFDQDLAKKSINDLLADTDLIIPGHGQPFFNTRDLKMS
ncbi:MBL fold metallo-hydrolase [candidate division CSSED10-310 bacterium]|uniref:MBL fold metallo-hydrolase n=1 Tax=candidate division CSSED10-310 bacterium TaxID=2855610 RepID=A0ABV6YTF9_UNCC1